MSMKIDRVTTDRLKLPLGSPYHLSQTTVEYFNTILVRVWADGHTSVGEVTTLEGYSDISIDEAWGAVSRHCQRLPGQEVETACQRLRNGTSPAFSKAAVTSALAHQISPPERLETPLVGITSAKYDVAKMVREIRAQREQGLETFKVKGGFDPLRDADRLIALAEATDLSSFRVDANKGYSLAEARTFLDHVDQSLLAHLEQPLPTNALDAHATLREETSVPVMLDEEVRETTSLSDLMEAADMVKLKMMKQGGPDATQETIERAADLGLGVVLGNGVQTGVGCIHEAQLWTAGTIKLAAECNGWLKQRDNLVRSGLTLEDGALVWEGGTPCIDPKVVSANRVASRTYDA